MTVSGELCCVALPFCCVVVVALPFSASLERLFIHALIRSPYSSSLSRSILQWKLSNQDTFIISLPPSFSLSLHPSCPLVATSMTFCTTVSGELCCVALPFCCVVVVALPFSASLERLFIHALIRSPYSSSLSRSILQWNLSNQDTFIIFLLSPFLSPSLPLPLPPSLLPLGSYISDLLHYLKFLQD